MKISEVIGKIVEINKKYKNDFYYEFENDGIFDYKFLERNGWKGKVVSVGCGRNVNIVVGIEEGEVKKYFEMDSMEVLVNGEMLDNVVNEWDWENVVDNFDYVGWEDGIVEDDEEEEE